MDIREEVLKKYEEFATFLESIHIEDWNNNYTRQELIEFKSKLNEIKIRSLPYEIGKLADVMKNEEFPQLLGIHHYPILNEIDFITEQKKIELDKFLSKIHQEQFVYNLFRFTSDTKQLQTFLLEKGIIEERYFFKCPHHADEKLTSGYTKERMERYRTAIVEKDYDILENFYNELYCEKCEYNVEYKEWIDNYLKVEYVLVKERDKSLDNV